MLDDIGEQVTFCGHAEPIDLHQAHGQIALLAGLHDRFHGCADLTGQLELNIWPDFLANAVSLRQEHSANHGFQAAEQQIPARLFARYEDIWPATVLHGDCHLKQWYVSPMMAGWV